MRRYHHESGFTMLEMIVVLALIAVMLTMSYGFIATQQSQARMDRIVADMKALTPLAERARVLPGGNTYVRADTAVIAAFVEGAGSSAGAVSTTERMLNEDGSPYLLTTTGRVGIVETDVEGLNIVPMGLDGVNVGGKSRLKAGFKLPRGMFFTKSAYFDKRTLYCEGYTAATKPYYCPDP